MNNLLVFCSDLVPAGANLSISLRVIWTSYKKENAGNVYVVFFLCIQLRQEMKDREMGKEKERSRFFKSEFRTMESMGVGIFIHLQYCRNFVLFNAVRIEGKRGQHPVV